MRKLLTGIRSLIGSLVFLAVLAVFLFAYMAVTNHPLFPTH